MALEFALKNLHIIKRIYALEQLKVKNHMQILEQVQRGCLKQRNAFNFCILQVYKKLYANLELVQAECLKQKLEPNKAAAFKLAFNHSIVTLNALQNIVVDLCNDDLGITLVDFQLKDLSIKASHFSMLYRRSEKYHNKTLGAEALRSACKDYNPQITLGILKTHTKCSPISKVQMETYLNGMLKSEQLEVDFNSVSSYDKLKYNFLKQCWLKIAFNAFKGNRAQMENFLNIILYQALQGAEQSLICASFTENNNHEAILRHLLDTQYLVLNITANIENFLTDIEKHIFPKFIATRIRSALLSTTIKPANMNATARKISDEITAIDDSKKFHYHILLTDLTMNNYGSKFQCKSGCDCLDITANNIRLIAVRFNVDKNMTEHVLDGRTLLLGNLPSWKKSIKHFAIKDKVDNFSQKFFPLTFNAFTTIILHIQHQFSSGTVINFGTNNITYQEVSTLYSIDHFVDYQWPQKDHAIKILFLIH